MHNHSYENEFNLHVNEISFSYEKMSTKTRFEEEAKGNSEMAYLFMHFLRTFKQLMRSSGTAPAFVNFILICTLDNGVMKSPKRREIISLAFTCL